MRVIVATDGSPDAKAAVEWTQRLPLPESARFLVVSVVPPPLLPNLPDWQTTVRQAQVHGAHEALDEACTLLGVSVEQRLAEGDAREEIIEIASEWAADLIVLGARGLSAVKEFLLGSVSLGVVRHAPCPVLVCKGSPRNVRTVTIAHDGSAGAREALRFVGALPLPPSTQVRILGVAEPLRYPYTAPEILGGALRTAVREVQEERRLALERVLAPEAAAMRGRVSTVDVRVTVGPPVEEIARQVDVTDSDLVVVGARGLGTDDSAAGINSHRENWLRKNT